MSAVVLVTRAGDDAGSRAAAAALACAASRLDSAALLLDLDARQPPRPSLVATAAARQLEERLGAHLPDARVASRGRICRLVAPVGPSGLEAMAATLPLVRESALVVHLPPSLLQTALAEPRTGVTAALLRADLDADRALAALAVRDLMERRIEAVVLKRPLGWALARAALLGALPAGAGLPPRMLERLLR